MGSAKTSRRGPSGTRYRDEKFLKKLGARFKKIRTAKGYSIDRIHLESGISRATASHIERGMVDPQASTLKRLAETIGVRFAELMDID